MIEKNLNKKNIGPITDPNKSLQDKSTEFSVGHQNNRSVSNSRKPKRLNFESLSQGLLKTLDNRNIKISSQSSGDKLLLPEFKRSESQFNTQYSHDPKFGDRSEHRLPKINVQPSKMIYLKHNKSPRNTARCKVKRPPCDFLSTVNLNHRGLPPARVKRRHILPGDLTDRQIAESKLTIP